MLPPAKQRVRASFDRAAASYDAAAVLQRQVCDRLLAGFAADPLDILDAGCGTGYGSLLLRRRWPSARIAAADFAPAMLALARRHADDCLAADIEALPFADGVFDAWWSNLSLQWCSAGRVFSEAARVLRRGARLAVSTLGPGTFHELRDAFRGIDPYRHTLPFNGPDDLGKALAGAGFRNIAWQRETIAVHYTDLKTLLRAVKAVGANRVGGGARPGMMGRAAWQALESAYERRRAADGLPASYDVVLGYAEKH
ncbi:MAG: malonyl-ACP O-methyltransferase BioC [Betaproteobacteria bacterium]|nr:malonyl-ACP O-methyltransferase BioC [Betaproteobacteria bacterium]